MLDIKYIILIWIVLLIIFTFYCIYRLNTELFKPPITTSTTSTTSTNKFRTVNNFENIFDYLNNITKNDSENDITGCSSIFDDNLEVRQLGYNNCNNAVLDYSNKNLDMNKLYGYKKALTDICPMASKSDKYMQCLKRDLIKYTDNATILEKINNEMANTINNRLEKRNLIVVNMENEMNPFIFNNMQKKFDTDNLVDTSIKINNNQKLNIINKYFKNKYQENFTNLFESNILANDIINTFFGNYKPVKGQYLAFDNITILFNYEPLINSTTTITNTNVITQSINTSSIITIPITTNTSNVNNNKEKKIYLTFMENNTKSLINYEVYKIDYVNFNTKIIKIELINENIDSNYINSPELKTFKKLINLLGIRIPTRLFISIDEFIDTEDTKHTNYKLLNENMDTIMIMNKMK